MDAVGLCLIDIIRVDDELVVGIVAHEWGARPGWHAFRIHEIVLVLDTGSRVVNIRMAEWLLERDLASCNV